MDFGLCNLIGIDFVTDVFFECDLDVWIDFFECDLDVWIDFFVYDLDLYVPLPFWDRFSVGWIFDSYFGSGSDMSETVCIDDRVNSSSSGNFKNPNVSSKLGHEFDAIVIIL
jgi:hypothetical protein